jgi:hypothetical protein
MLTVGHGYESNALLQHIKASRRLTPHSQKYEESHGISHSPLELDGEILDQKINRIT